MYESPPKRAGAPDEQLNARSLGCGTSNGPVLGRPALFAGLRRTAVALFAPVRNRFDQLGKKIGLEALGPSGVTIGDDEISPDAHHADLRHEPDPAREAERYACESQHVPSKFICRN